jgi:ketosteroid isomerase-like protein
VLAKEEYEMPANSPEEICRLFQQYMREGDIDSVLSLYDPEVVFLNQAGEPKRGEKELREELAPFARVKAIFDFTIKQIIRSGDIALTHTDWTISAPRHLFVYAIEVARRQPDGTWRWLIGDPFTVGKRIAS